MDDRKLQPPSSPWRQPIMWLVVGLPLLVVVASVVMVIMAGAGGTDAVREEVRRTAQIQTADLGPDQIARAEKLSAIVRVDAEGGFVEVLPVSGRFDRGAPLQLVLQHPAHSAQDMTLALQPHDTGWRADADVGDGNDWNIRLGPDDGRWRLAGRLPAGQQATSLRPALQAP